MLQRGGVHLVEVVADGESEKCTTPFVVPSNQVSSRRTTLVWGTALHSVTNMRYVSTQDHKIPQTYYVTISLLV